MLLVTLLLLYLLGSQHNETAQNLQWQIQKTLQENREPHAQEKCCCAADAGWDTALRSPSCPATTPRPLGGQKK